MQDPLESFERWLSDVEDNADEEVVVKALESPENCEEDFQCLNVGDFRKWIGLQKDTGHSKMKELDEWLQHLQIGEVSRLEGVDRAIKECCGDIQEKLQLLLSISKDPPWEKPEVPLEEAPEPGPWIPVEEPRQTTRVEINLLQESEGESEDSDVSTESQSSPSFSDAWYKEWHRQVCLNAHYVYFAEYWSQMMKGD